MSNIIRFDPSSTIVQNRVTEYLKSVNTPDYSGDILINPNLTNVESISMKYWKVILGEVVEMTEEEKYAIDNFLNSKSIPFKKFLVKEYSNNKKLIKESWYEIDNGDGTYSIKAEETEYFYNCNLLDYRILKTFYYDGTVLFSEKWGYYTNGTKIIEKKIVEE